MTELSKREEQYEMLADLVEETVRSRVAVTTIGLIVAAKRRGLLPAETPTETARIRMQIAIRHLRKRLTNEVLICAGNRYQFALTAKEAEKWRKKRCKQVVTQIEGVNLYAAAEAKRFGEGKQESEAWAMAHESLLRAQKDVERAARMSFG